jgi:hypothetical protein
MMRLMRRMWLMLLLPRILPAARPARTTKVHALGGTAHCTRAVAFYVNPTARFLLLDMRPTQQVSPLADIQGLCAGPSVQVRGARTLVDKGQHDM